MEVFIPECPGEGELGQRAAQLLRQRAQFTQAALLLPCLLCAAPSLFDPCEALLEGVVRVGIVGGEGSISLVECDCFERVYIER